MSSATFLGNSDSSDHAGFCPAPPPPPPPPVPGQMPATRINTSIESPMLRRPQVRSSDPYEPPAAIQNAMMTKDKKPFTYTPGMGGKLDLSQIRSPRMARRVAKNANDEGVEGPVKSPLASEQPRPVSTGANLYIQPQVAVPVFPTGPPVVSQAPRAVQVPRPPASSTESAKPTVKIEAKIPSPPAMSPDTPTTPTLVTLTKAPTPWLQNKNKPQEELPEWAKRPPTNGSSLFSPSDNSPNVQTLYIQPAAPPSPPQPPAMKQTRPVQQVKVVQTPIERVIPLRVEDRPSVFSAKNEPGHHQLRQSTPNHQQRWGHAVAPQTPSPPAMRVVVPSSPKPHQQANSPTTFIVPIVVEGNNNDRGPTVVNSPYQQQGNRNVVQRTPASPQDQGPVQSRSFRVLQKITDTDGDEPEQLRKLQLNEEDKQLMNKFKEQVDGEVYLHQEEDPRYRGSAIPSRAFRYLQTMTDSTEMPLNNNAPRAVNSALKRQNRNSKTFEESQAGLPPSEQQVQEPKKYTGSAIPSRSFRILQAMTTPESMAMQDCRQADFACQVSSSMMPQGNQQAVFIPRYSQPIYWAYCPIPYPTNPTNTQYPPSIAYIPVYDHNFLPAIAINDAYHQTPDNPSEPIYFMDPQDGNIHSNQLDPSENESENLTTPQASSDDAWNKIESAPKNSETYSMNIVHEEDNTEADRSTNDENVPSEQELCSDLVSSSSESDSDSYLAYSTGLNRGQEVKDKSEESEDKQITDCESYVEEEEDVPESKPRDERVDTPNDIDSSGWNVPDDGDDNNALETVNVSIPLKMKPQDDNVPDKTSENDICVSVDFTLKKQGSPRPKSWCPQAINDDFWTSKTIVEHRTASPASCSVQKSAIKEEEREVEEEIAQDEASKVEIEVEKVPQFEIIVEDEVSINKIDEETLRKDKGLLTVQNSREETDDDDSGVTSDMSRLISEVDTDSECAPARTVTTYTRTQTHSRLFKLLNEDLKIEEDLEKPLARRCDRRNRLSLPLKQSNRDSSNYSSDLTSSECSPVQESSWRPLQQLQKTLNGKDSYFHTWKQDQKPAEMSAKVTRIPLKCNVLCPRIKSSKSVPKALQARPNKPPTSSRGKYECC